MIRIKSGVKFKDIQPELLFAIIVADQQNSELYTWITSVNDSKHKDGSLHYKGLAVDLRTKNHPTPRLWADAIQRILNQGEYQVLFEYEGTDNEHIHIEYDPPQINT